MDSPNANVSNQKEESISIQRLNKAVGLFLASFFSFTENNCWTLSMLNHFIYFFVDFFKLTFFKTNFKNTIIVPNSLDPDQN